MKVLHIYRTYFPDPPGGLQEAIRQICAGCRDQGVESAIFALSPQPLPADIDRPEGRVHRARSWWAPASCDLGGWNAVRRFSTAADWADVLHFHFPWPYADLLNLLPAARKPKLMTYHSDIVKQKLLGALYAPLMHHTLGSMDAVVATSPPYAKTSQVLTRWVHPKRLKVIPLCMEDVPHQTGTDTGLLQRLGLRSGQPFFLALGVLRYYKGLHTLIEAAGQTRARIVIAGSGPEREALQAQVQNLGITNVVFAGQVSETEKHALLGTCTALVLPSHLRSEAYGMVLLEAAVHARPMISCEIGTGTSYINQHGQTGLVVAPEAPAQLADAMNRFVDEPGLALRLGDNARVRYEQHFSLPVMAGAYARLYREISPH